MHQPPVFAQARRRHQGGQRVPFSRRRGRHRDASRAALRLPRPGGDEPFADGAGPVFGRDVQVACGPVRADLVQRRCDDPLAQVGYRDAAGEPGENLPRRGLVAGNDRGVQPVRLGRPVTHPDLRWRRGARGPAFRQSTDVTIADLVATRGLPGGEHSLAYPSVRGLIVHPEDVGGFA
jgi:hypothetical protein